MVLYGTSHMRIFLEIGKKIILEISFFLFITHSSRKITSDITGKEMLSADFYHGGHITVSAIERVKRRCQRQTDTLLDNLLECLPVRNFVNKMPHMLRIIC